VMQVECPKESKPGDQITVVIPDAGAMIVVVPPGAQPGKPFAVQVPMTQAPTQAVTAVRAVTIEAVPNVLPASAGYSAPSAPAAQAAPAASAVKAATADLDLLASKQMAEPTDFLSGETPQKAAAAPDDLLDLTTTPVPVVPDPADRGTPPGLLSDPAADVTVVADTPSVDQARLAAVADIAALYAQSPKQRSSPTAGLEASPPEVTTAEAADKFAALAALDGQPLVDSPPHQLVPEAIPGASEPKERFQELQDSLITGFNDSYKEKDDRSL